MMDDTSDRSPGPRWLPWVCLGLLALPFHPLWVDFEQVRRGLLLVLVGAMLCALPRLPRAHGVSVGAAFVSALALSGGGNPLVRNNKIHYHKCINSIGPRITTTSFARPSSAPTL